MVSRTVLLVTLTMLFTFACCLSSSSSAVVKTSIRNKGSGRWNRLFNQSRWINRITRRITPAIKSTANKINIMKPKFSAKGDDHSPEAYLTSTQIITYRGYTAQTFYVTTDDGYILELHRIPYGKSASSTTGRPIFLQHGFLDTDADWLISPVQSSLAFRLADLGYDVWLGNARGNTYSRKHTYLDPNQDAYWNFSYDEMGKFDIPAVINFIIGTTGKSKLLYIGHSMGCAMFFIAMVYHPELNSKIELMIALGPATTLAHMSSPVRFLAPFVNQIQLMFWLMRVRVLLDNNAPLPRLQRRFCEFGTRTELLCRSSILSIVGDDANDMPLELLPVMAHHNPAGVSIHTAAQFAQNYNSGETFIPYDFGWWGNYARYGQIRPPAYDLNKVTCPVYLFYGENDLLVVPQDVAWLASKLPNLKQSIRVDHPTYNHFDFLWATDNNRLLYDQLIGLLPSATSL